MTMSISVLGWVGIGTRRKRKEKEETTVDEEEEAYLCITSGMQLHVN